MKAGRMRHRLRFDKPADNAVDGFVGVVKTPWVAMLEVDASIDPMSGRDGFGADRELAGLNFRITLRETGDVQIEPNWRAVDVDRGWTYDVQEVLPSHDRAVLVLRASSGTAQP